LERFENWILRKIFGKQGEISERHRRLHYEELHIFYFWPYEYDDQDRGWGD
jgi:hypothetical protein